MGKRGTPITSPIPEAASTTVTLWPARLCLLRQLLPAIHSSIS